VTRWEYGCEEGRPDKVMLDKRGAEGWELVAFDSDGDAWFKRPIEEREEGRSGKVKSKHDIKVGDVWESEHGRKVKIKSVYTSGTGRERVRVKTLATGAEGSCLTDGFVSRRRLIERGGKPVTAPTVPQ
jgi:hypothetical protein